MLQVNNFVYVIYSRFYLDLGKCKSGKTPLCRGLASVDQGIKLARVDLAALTTLPQFFLPPDTRRRDTPNMNFLIDHYVHQEAFR
jgi:hypothetical protein